MQDRYIPPGYISVEKAIFGISKAMAPYLWQTVPAEELAIWKQTVGNFRGLDLLPELVNYLRRSGL